MVNCSGADPVQRGNSAQKDVIQAVIRARLLQGQQIARLLDHAQQVPLPPGVAADVAFLFFRQIITVSAIPHVFLDVADGVGQRHRLAAADPQDVIGQSLGRLLADARHLGKLVDQARSRSGSVRAWRITPFLAWMVASRSVFPGPPGARAVAGRRSSLSRPRRAIVAPWPPPG